MSSQGDTSVRQRFKPPQTDVANKISQKPNKPKRPPPPAKSQYELDTRIVFYFLFVSHTIAAIWSPILDCDETFNYWEPTHYLSHGHGFETWEYSPEHAIRSWTYAGIHAVFTLFGRWIPGAAGSKAVEFYTVRILLALCCALTETRLFTKISSALNPRIAVTFLIIMATSTGVFHASVAYLPSSFAMYFVNLGIAAFMDWRGGLRTAEGMMCFGIAAILGWPFSAILCVPFLFEELLLGSLSDRDAMAHLFWRLVDGTVRCLVILAIQFSIELFFYKKMLLVPWNIVAYNIFSKKGGPDLYGTEPWHFYLRNLFLNFNLWLPLALISMPLLLAQQILGGRGATRSSYLRGIVFLSPFYIWLGIFTLQPHKEERFMYPIYPALALNAAMSLHIILANFGSTDARHVVAKIPIQLRLGAILTFVFGTMAFSIWRTFGTVTAYGATLTIYKPLLKLDISPSTDYVCVGKEWYRFPSHFLLPNDMRAKFIKSEFDGLLPGEFSEAASGFGVFPGTWLVPPGMNDENLEDPGKHTSIKYCSFLVDTHLPSTQTTLQEPSYILDEKNWEKIQCLPFLDASSTGLIGRLGWLPDLPFIPPRFRRVWGQHCLLRRKSKQRVLPPIDTAPHLETML